MNIPAEPWVVTTPDKVRIGSRVWTFARARLTDKQAYMRATAEGFSLLSDGMQIGLMAREDHIVAVCSVTDLINTAPTKNPRFPGTCPRCGRGTYTSAFFVEHDGECAP